MTGERLNEILARCDSLKVLVVGDVALDRYLEIDPSIEETSLETGLAVHNVVNVRPQAGAGGNVLACAAALAPARLAVVGFCGDDGEGYELRRCLERMGVDLRGFIIAPDRMTFTYTKPLVTHPAKAPQELSRLDIRTRTATGGELEKTIIERLCTSAAEADVIIAMDQMPEPSTGALTAGVRDALAKLARDNGQKVFIADSRFRIGDFADVRIKVNRSELLKHFGAGADADVESLALRWAQQIGSDVFVTLGADGILAAWAGGVERIEGIPAEGPADIVGAGDSVLAGIALALGAGASVAEAAQIGNLAGSIVVRKIGTTGSATRAELAAALDKASRAN